MNISAGLFAVKVGTINNIPMRIVNSVLNVLIIAMNLGETYLVTETGNERLGKQKLDLVIL